MLVEDSMAMGTSLVPLIDSDRAAEIAKESARTRRPVRSLREEKQVLPPAELTKPGGEDRAGG